MGRLQTPCTTDPSFSMAEFPADMVHAARTLIRETKNRLDPEKFQRFSDTLPYLARRAASKLPDHTAMLVEEILDRQTDLIEKFNAFLPEEKHRVKIKRDSLQASASENFVPEACAKAVDFVNRLGRRDEKLLRSVLEVFDSCNREEIGRDDIVREIVELLKGEPQSLQEFTTFLPVTEATPIPVIPYVMEEGEIRDSEDEEQRNPKKGKLSQNPNYNNSEEHRNPEKRAESSENNNPNNYEIIQSKILNSAFDNLDEQVTLSWPSLYRYSKGRRFNPADLSLEFQTLLFLLKPIENEREQGSEKLDESLRGRRTRQDRESAETMMNEIEEERYNLDMMERYLISAKDYLEGTKEELGEMHLRTCVEAMYDATEDVVEMAMENPEFLSRIVKKRVHQKLEELRGVREKLTQIWKAAIDEHCK